MKFSKRDLSDKTASYLKQTWHLAKAEHGKKLRAVFVRSKCGLADFFLS